MSEPDPQRKQQLLEAEGQFWDLQEERIESLYARPHDWRFVPALAERIIAPRIRALERIFAERRFASLLDIGCGNGWFCHAAAKRGIRSIGVDLSEKKIETAKRLAREQGVADLCEFAAGDVLQWSPSEPVELLTSHGSLHHFPEFERALGHMVTHFLRPGGRMLFVEPNFEGMSPGVRSFLMGCARAPLLGKLFDLDFYLEVTGQPSLEAPPVESGEVNIRHESPAGKEFFGEHIDLDRFFTERFVVLDRRFFHYFAGHATNAFHVFMKSRVVRGLWRAALPAIVWADDRMLRKPAYQAYAEEGLWYLARKGEA